MRKYLALALMVSACGVQSIPRAKNNVEAAAAEVGSQYKRRADLIPNLVQTVKAYAAHEQTTFVEVTEARAKASSVQLNVSDAEQLQKYQQAQGQLSQALGKLMVVAEKYPELKANENFRDLQAQLEGTENRITVARQRHIEAIKSFNDLVTVFPTSLTARFILGEAKLAQWSNPEEQSAPPKVEF